MVFYETAAHVSARNRYGRRPCYRIGDDKGEPDMTPAKRKHHEDLERLIEERTRELRERERNLSTILENAGSGILLADISGHFIFGNQMAADITGYPLDELLQLGFSDIVHPSELTAVRDNFQKRISGVTVPPYEITLIQKNGSSVSIELNAVLATWDGKPVSMGIINDISERIQTEEALKNHAKRLAIINRIITKASQGGDLTSVLSGVLDSTLDLMGFDGGGIYMVDDTGSRADLTVHKGLPEDFIADVDEIPISVEGDGSIHVSGKLFFTDREPVIAEDYSQVNPRRAEKWGFTSLASLPLFVKDRFVGIFNIITKAMHRFSALEQETLNAIGKETGAVIARSRAEAALKESEARFRMIADYTFDWESFRDWEGRLLYVNPSFERITGYRTDDYLTGKICFDDLFDDGKEREEADSFLQSALQGQIVDNKELHLRRKDGRQSYISVSSQPVVDTSGERIGIRSSIREITKLKQAEEALRESETWLKLISETSTDFILMIDTDGVVKYINRTLTGLPREEIIGSSFFSYIPDHYQDTVKACFSRVLATGKNDQYETTYPLKDGTILNFEARVAPVFRDEKIVSFTISSNDITARRRIEQALRESETRYRALVEQADDHIFLVDTDLKIVSINPSAAGVLGKRVDAIIGQTIIDLFPPEFARRYTDNLGKVFKTGSGFEIEGTMPTDTGEAWISTRLSPIKNQQGSTVFVLGVSRNISDRKQIDTILKNSEAQYRTTINAMPDAIHVVDETLVIILVNQTFLDWLRELKLDDDILGKTVIEAFPFLEKGVMNEYSRIFETGRVLVTEETVNIEGRSLIVETRKVPIFEGGTVRRVITIISDITTRRCLENEILGVSAREQRRIGQDLHDGLGQQLTGISYLTKALEHKLSQAGAPEASEASRLSELVKQTVAQTRALARGLCPVDMDEMGLLTSLEKLAEQTTDIYSTSCQLTFEGDIRIGDTDLATHLYRIAQEAVTNAIKHGQARQITIHLNGEETTITLTVTDDGLGFAHVSPGPGGLGVKIMQYRANVIGGTFAITSPEEGGTVVSCNIPGQHPVKSTNKEKAP